MQHWERHARGFEKGPVALRCGAGVGWVSVTGKGNKIQSGMEEGRLPQPLAMSAWLRIRRLARFLHTTLGVEDTLPPSNLNCLSGSVSQALAPLSGPLRWLRLT